MKSTRFLFVAVLVVLATVTVTILTEKPKPEVNEPAPSRTVPTMSQARKEASIAATRPTASSRKKFLSAAGTKTIQEITHTSDTSSEEFWQESLTKLQSNDSLPDHEMGKMLTIIASNPKAPEWVRAEAMTEALVFTDDENYVQSIKPLAIRADLPESVNDVILEDLLNRSPVSVLPVARQIANTSGHPLAGVFDEFVKSCEKEASSDY